jgi:hypothetical protein
MAAREHSIVDKPATVDACKADRDAAQTRAESNPSNTPRVPVESITHRR